MTADPLVSMTVDPASSVSESPPRTPPSEPRRRMRSGRDRRVSFSLSPSEGGHRGSLSPSAALARQLTGLKLAYEGGSLGESDYVYAKYAVLQTALALEEAAEPLCAPSPALRDPLPPPQPRRVQPRIEFVHHQATLGEQLEVSPRNDDIFDRNVLRSAIDDRHQKVETLPPKWRAMVSGGRRRAARRDAAQSSAAGSAEEESSGGGCLVM